MRKPRPYGPVICSGPTAQALSGTPAANTPAALSRGAVFTSSASEPEQIDRGIAMKHISSTYCKSVGTFNTHRIPGSQKSRLRMREELLERRFDSWWFYK